MLEVCQKLPQSVVGSVVTAAVAGVGLAAVKLLNDKLQHRLPVPLPGELLMVRVLALGRRGACRQAGERDPEASSVGGGGFLGLGPSAEGPHRHLPAPNDCSGMPKAEGLSQPVAGFPRSLG